MPPIRAKPGSQGAENDKSDWKIFPPKKRAKTELGSRRMTSAGTSFQITKNVGVTNII